MRIEVRRSQGAKPWYYRIVGRNGAICLVSEGYSQKANAVRAAKNMFESIASEPWELQVSDEFTAKKFQK